jgi:hypothetical protein
VQRFDNMIQVLSVILAQRRFVAPQVFGMDDRFPTRRKRNIFFNGWFEEWTDYQMLLQMISIWRPFFMVADFARP